MTLIVYIFSLDFVQHLMVYNTSYYDRTIIREINDLVGDPFSLIERLKLRGVGSARLVMESASPDVLQRLPSDESIVNASIELRPNGIIVHFKKFTEHYAWPIPFYKLTIYHSSALSIYGNGTFMKFANGYLHKTHRDFLRKVINHKVKSLEHQIHY